MSFALNITTVTEVWDSDWEISVGLTGWSIAAMIIALVLSIVENTVIIRTNIGFIYDDDSKKSSTNIESFLSALWCFLTAELLGIMFLVYSIFGLIGYNLFTWILASFSSSSLLMFGGMLFI